MSDQSNTIDTEYFQMDISNILYILTRDLKQINTQYEFDFDNIIHDYLLQLRYQLDYNDAKSIILNRIYKDSLDLNLNQFDIVKAIEILLSSMYYQMCYYGLYNRGELDYQLIKSNTIHVCRWIDEYTPIFECIDRPNIEPILSLERLFYITY